MKRELKISKDGSHTIYVPSLDEHYHSSYGAISESLHIFIGAGLQEVIPVVIERSPESAPRSMKLLEIGFGTGLNAILTMLETEDREIEVDYTAIEKYPVEQEHISALNYPELLETRNPSASRFETHSMRFGEIHNSEWGEYEMLSGCFNLRKIEVDIVDMKLDEQYDLVYFDAFAPDIQPQLWSEEVFKNIFDHMRPGGVLVTYSVKGVVKRAMQKAGFEIEKLPGPAGKRQILRARVPS